MSPSAREGLIPAGPRPGGKRGSPASPSPAPGPLSGQCGAPGAALTVQATMPPPLPTRAAPAPHAARGPYPSPAGGPRTPGAPQPLSAPPPSPVPGGPGGAGRGRRRGVSPRPGDAAGGRRAAGGIPVPLFVSGSSVPPRRLLLRLRLGLATRVSLSLGEKRKCSNSNY
ncbi:translation initiation factor IF-2-like [Zalophus californianus]|uniref:Translation initiation factor IF-2-like n=1 Tax=Zalophus californianus TaxID=9704 RepID=A0A6J2C562_ZALCA|nr:translation initiation factor IF-2-like [Zalophus californianus]